MIERIPTIDDIEANTKSEKAIKAICCEYTNKINELVDTVNRLEESVQGVVNNSIADGGRIQSLQEQIHALKTRSENVCKPITLIDMFNEMGRLYADLWNKLEDIHHELRKEQQ